MIRKKRQKKDKAPASASRKPTPKAPAKAPAKAATRAKVRETASTKPPSVAAASGPPAPAPDKGRGVLARIADAVISTLKGARKALAVPALQSPVVAQTAVPPSPPAPAAAKTAAPPAAPIHRLPVPVPAAAHRTFASEAILARFELEPPRAEPEPRPAPYVDWGLDIPSEYDDTRIVLLVRDPEWVYAYWEISQSDRARHGLRRGRRERQLVLRIYDLAGRRIGGRPAFHDVAVDPDGNNWYVRLAPGRDFAADLGTYDQLGRFVAVAASNPIRTPRNVPSEETGEAEWMIVAEEFEAIYGESGGHVVAREQMGSECTGSLQRETRRATGFQTFPFGASEATSQMVAVKERDPEARRGAPAMQRETKDYGP